STLSALHITLLLQALALIYPFKPTFFNWFVGWLGQINGILCLTPLCLMFDPFTLPHYFHRHTWRWWSSGLIILFCHLFYLFMHNPPAVNFALASFAVLAIYAYCFGQIPTCVLLLGISVLYLSLVFVQPPGFLQSHS